MRATGLTEVSFLRAVPTGARRQGQEPPSAISMAGALPHVSLHVDPPEQERAHDPVHVMRHVEPSAQLTLPLGPTVISHVEPPAQLTLQDAPHDPLHWLSSTQAREQLSLSQALLSVLHAEPGSQAHEVPLHSGGATSSPHPIRRPTTRGNA